MHQSFGHSLEPLVWVLATEVRVSGIKIDADAWTFDQAIDPIKPVGVFAVLLMSFQPDRDSSRLRHLRGFHQGVAHQNKILLLARPFWFRTFIGIDHRRSALGGETDRLLEILGADL